MVQGHVHFTTGGITKGFTTLHKLAEYIYQTYGDTWDKCVQVAIPATSNTATRATVSDMSAIDLHGIFPRLVFRYIH